MGLRSRGRRQPPTCSSPSTPVRSWPCSGRGPESGSYWRRRILLEPRFHVRLQCFCPPCDLRACRHVRMDRPRPGLGFHPRAGLIDPRGELPAVFAHGPGAAVSCSSRGRRRGPGDGTSARCPSVLVRSSGSHLALAADAKHLIVCRHEYSVSLKWSAKGACLLYCGGIFTETGSGGRGPQPRKFSCLCARYGTRRWFGPSGDLVPMPVH